MALLGADRAIAGRLRTLLLSLLSAPCRRFAAARGSKEKPVPVASVLSAILFVLQKLLSPHVCSWG